MGLCEEKILLGSISSTFRTDKDGIILHRSAATQDGEEYWIKLNNEADFTADGHRWRSARKYKIGKMSVWKLFKRGCSYSIQMHFDESMWIITSVTEIKDN